MPPEETQHSMVHCDTCGNRYTASIERCPRCYSNQRSKIRGAHPNMHCRRAEDQLPVAKAA